MTLTSDEAFILEWLGREEFSQYGECRGKALDGLIAKGFAEVHADPGLQAGFIAKGPGDMYRAVSLTEAGRAELQKSKMS